MYNALVFEGQKEIPVPVDENPTRRCVWWGRADWFVFVPWFLVLASFWIYLFGPDRAPWTEAMHEFYGMRHTAEIHTPWVMFGSLLIILYSFTLFLGRRLLFGRVARSWTIAIAILFIVLAAATGLAAWATYASSFL